MADPTTSSEPDHVFYNVLPAEKSAGPLASPGGGETTPQAAAPQISNTTTTKPKLSLPALNKRLLLIIALALVIILAGGFFGYRLLFNKSKAPALTPPVDQTPADSSSQPQTPAQPEGVTTSSDWQKQYFGQEICQNVTVCGDDSDPDRDGLTNLEESTAQTDPNNSDSDGDRLADGDEVHIFGGDPLKAKTTNGQYTDLDYAQYGYDLSTDQQYTPDKLADIIAKIKQSGLHQPSITALGEQALKYYDFASTETDTDHLQGVDTSPDAQLDRDTQRLDTIKKIGAALVKYKTDHQTYPDTTEFDQMTTAVKPYITVATNFSDPVNKGKYVYGYMSANSGTSFNLTYFSETQNLLVKYTDQQAVADAGKQSSAELDDIRTRDLETLQTALLLYSSHNIDAHSTQQYVFPTADQYKNALLSGNYIAQIPTDPKTGQDYPYTVGEKFDTFTVKAMLDNPPPGATGYYCDESQCKSF